MNKNYLLTIFLSLICYGLQAQTNKNDETQKMMDSIKRSYLLEAAMKQPAMRQGAVSVEIIGGGDQYAKVYGEDLYQGRAQTTRIRSNFNFPVASLGKTSFSSSVGLLQQQTMIVHVKNLSSQYRIGNMIMKNSTYSLTLNASRMDSLFGKPVFLNASVTGLTDQDFVKPRFNFSGFVSFPIKKTLTTAISLGAILIVGSSSSPTPIAPYFSLWHKFKANDLELFIDIPSRILLRKGISERSSVSFGTALGGTLSLFDTNNALTPRHAVHSSLELKTGPAFEHRIGKKVIFGINGGVLSTLSSRAFDRNKNESDYFFKNSSGSAPYVNFSISLLPMF